LKTIKSKWEIVTTCTRTIEENCENWGNPAENLEIEKIMIEMGEKREMRLKLAEEKKRIFRNKIKKTEIDKNQGQHTKIPTTKIAAKSAIKESNVERRKNCEEERKCDADLIEEENSEFTKKDKNLQESLKKIKFGKNLPVSDMGCKNPSSSTKKENPNFNKGRKKTMQEKEERKLKVTPRKSVLGLERNSPMSKLKLKRCGIGVTAKGGAKNVTTSEKNYSRVNLIVKNFENFSRGRKQKT
jgi:hypothetical protein